MMDWINRLTKALDYVEANLTARLDFEDVAREADTSSFHFQRMFSILTDVTLGEYIRRRRLTLAARDILEGKEILETAVKYGYDSQASFTRAFSRLHGLTPGAARAPGVKIKAYPPISFHLTIKGEHSMEYEIRELKSFKVAGFIRRFTSKEGKNFKEIPEFWQEMNPELEKMCALANPDGLLKGAVIGGCLNFSGDTQEEFDYIIGIEPGKDWGKLEVREVPALTWAVFKGSGPLPGAIQNLWKRIFGDWFPATDYIHDEGPELEIYLPEGTKEDHPFEVWIPIKKERKG